jgi:hypothetical protein
MKPRNPQERLDRAIPRVARQFGIAETRVRTWVSFLAISGALQSALERGELAFYPLKGGAALELRFPGILTSNARSRRGSSGNANPTDQRFDASIVQRL